MTPLGQRPPVAGGADLDVPAGDVRLRATSWSGSGVPVLLLHGLASTRRFWDPVVTRLPGRAVVTLDQRGHGDSDRPAGPYDAGTVAADALAALDVLGLAEAVVVGHSWGASVALRLAAEHPGRVRAVVALDGGLGTARDAGTDRADARRRLEPPPMALSVPDLTALLSGAPWWSDEVAAAVLPIFEVGADGLARRRLPYEAHMNIVDDLLDTEAELLLPRIGCPAWLVACEPVGGDAWGARKAAALERAGPLLARPRLLRWTGAAHDVPLQWPALVAGLVAAVADEAAAELPAEATA